MFKDKPGTWIVTGGAGFIGSNFVRLALAETGARIVVVDALTYAGNLESLREVADHPRFVFRRLDIAERAGIEALFRETRPEAVLNFAAETHVDRSIDGPRVFVRTNVQGTLELLEASRALRAELPPAERERFRFLHVSTDEVFGSLGPEGAFSETTPYAPRSPYSASKAGADHLVRAWHDTYGLPTLLDELLQQLRPLPVPREADPADDPDRARGEAAADLRRRRPRSATGSTSRTTAARSCASSRRGGPASSYNVGGGSERTNLQVVDRICALLEELRPGPRRYAELKRFVEDRPGHDRRYAIDDHRLRGELGWAPRHDFETGLRATVEWYLANADWCEHVQSGSYRRERLGLGAA